MTQLNRFAALLLLLAAAPALAVDTPGLVQEKPAKGPFVKTAHGYMVPYESRLPGSEVVFKMMPIPGGKFRLGSPASEAGRKDDEGPQFEVQVEPFWMSATEITWAEYKQFMSLHDIFKKFDTRRERRVTDENRADAITAPSNLYDPSFTFQSGSDPQQPALSMSQYAAKQYTKWLSLTGGIFYRLPTEAEWEHAARAGTKTAFSFGDDPAQLGDYAWFTKNADDKTHKVGQKKPNAWGLYDMHGNVSEWVLDGYEAKGYERFTDKSVAAADAVQWPTKLYPRVVRGGSFDDVAVGCRSAVRHKSNDDDWRAEDPNIPLSPWWFTSDYALGVGFRLLRPLEPPPRAEQEKFWRADLELVQEDVMYRIEQEGRGALGVVDPTLIDAIEELNR
ncbi:formylglycine-generating enzyme family protein [Lignipirellula cremea]|uniref:Serine/threonine-protein kinase pkn1 n=1 Tax=Lignipirellula cremea TaxID=2528010 RepID=A0A518DUW9_9BACT|nr:formylglycine-generating enzyme family protein [Lignipirellula cremea]QDU95629.1 Serine/threonine-protein kinase pkn1 [Lignipirellula cremea]